MHDALTSDPPAGLDPPAETHPVTFTSAGEDLLGVLHVPAGPGPHPVVVVLHGFPGTERNFDLAQVLRRAGYASLVFHYRGSWGMGGDYSWGNVLADTAAVLAGLRAGPLPAGDRLDPSRLALVGHSLGGFVALMTAAADPSVAAVASVAAFDFGSAGVASREDAGVRAGYVAAFGAAQAMLPLRGTSGEALVAEMEAAGDAWRLAGLAPRLADRPVLLVGTGDRDGVTPAGTHHEPVVRAYDAHPLRLLEHRVLPTDHALSDQRVELARAVTGFLRRHLPPAA